MKKNSNRSHKNSEKMKETFYAISGRSASKKDSAKRNRAKYGEIIR